MRLRKVKGAAETIAAHPQIVIPNGEELKGNWQSVFEKNQPLYIEVGMGKGQFVIGMAQKNPHLNFIGIEKFDSVMVRALEKVIEAGELPNLKLLKIDAEDLTNIFEDNEVEG
ncbi:MAG: tRNA (guanosine(46)-N7)-methyltransferase TrmB, partial [Turicibacter sp.]|nr:tRNA (guanosine(46)-N7)-methyltransferase TrmB [Turicibacter sp.]